MKVTKNILREIVEAEMKLLNEARTVNAINKSLAQAQKLIKAEMEARAKGEEDREKILLRDLGDGEGQRLFDRLSKDKRKLAGWTLIKNNETVSDLTAAIDQSLATMTTEQEVLDKIAKGVEEAELANKSPDDDATAGAGPEAQSSGDSKGLSSASKEMLTKIATEGGVLRKGSKGGKVELLQQALLVRLLGNKLPDAALALGRIDRDFGGKTKTAVEAIQKEYKITVDGVVGRNTAASLLADKNAKGSAKVRRRRGGDKSAGPGGEVPAQDANPRPADLGASFEWHQDLEVWWSERSHNYGGEDFNLWIRKDGKDYHTNGAIGNLEEKDFPASAQESKSLPERLGMILSESLVLTRHDSKTDGDTLPTSDVFQKGRMPVDMSNIPGLEDMISAAANQAPDRYTHQGQGQSMQAMLALDADVNAVDGFEKYIYRDYVGNDDINKWFYDDGSGNMKLINIDNETIANQIETEFRNANFVDMEDPSDTSAGDEETIVAQSAAWDTMEGTIHEKQLEEIKNLEQSGVKKLIIKIRERFADSFRTFLDEDFYWGDGGNLTKKARAELINTFIPRSPGATPEWAKMVNIEQTFANKLEEILKSSEFKLFDGPGGGVTAMRTIKKEFKDDLLAWDSTESYNLSVHIGSRPSFFPLKGGDNFKAVIEALYDVKNNWDAFKSKTESDPEVKEESLSYGRLQELAGILQG